MKICRNKQQKLRDFLEETSLKNIPTFTLEEASSVIFGKINTKTKNDARTRINLHRRKTKDMIFRVGKETYASLPENGASREHKIKFAGIISKLAGRNNKTGESFIGYSDDLFNIIDEVKGSLSTDILWEAMENAFSSQSRIARKVAKELKAELQRRANKKIKG